MSEPDGRIIVHANPDNFRTDGIPDLRFVIEYRANRAGLVLSVPSAAEVPGEGHERHYEKNLREFCAVVLAALVRNNVEWRLGP